MFARNSLVAGVVALVATSVSAQTVYVVDDDGGPGVDFTSIQAAVDLSVFGDIILVKDGSYFGFTIDDRTAVITADAGAIVSTGPVTVSNLAATQSVAISGLQIFNGAGIAVSCNNNAGPVSFEQCSIQSDGLPFFVPNDGIRISSSDAVTFSQCDVSVDPGAGPSPALSASDSSVHLYECSLSAGDGISGFQGGNGAQLFGGFLFASGTTFTGGRGAEGTVQPPFDICTDGGAGGNGLSMTTSVTASVPVVKLVDCIFTGGQGGEPGGPLCAAGPTGLGIQTFSGTVETLAVTAHTLDVGSPIREGETTDLVFQGEPGEHVWLFYSLTQAPTYSGVVKGTLVPGPNRVTIYLGQADGNGTLAAPVTFPVHPSGASFTLFEQGLFFNAVSRFVLTNPELSIVLDESL